MMAEQVQKLKAPHLEVPPLPFFLASDIIFDGRAEEVVEGLFQAGTVTVLFGDPSTGKSALLTSLLAHLSAGTAWLGRQVERGASIFVAGERAAVTSRRLRAAAAALGQKDPAVAIVMRKTDDLDLEELVDRMVSTADVVSDGFGLPVRVIVFDTLASCFPSRDENATKEMTPLMQAFARIAVKTGAAVIIVHHQAKGSDLERGSSGIRACADQMIRTTKKRDGFTARIVKRNDGEENSVIRFGIEGSDDGETALVVAVDPELEERPDARDARRPDRQASGKDTQFLAVLKEAGGSMSRHVALALLRDRQVLVGKTDATRIALGRMLTKLSDAKAIRVQGDLIEIVA